MIKYFKFGHNLIFLEYIFIDYYSIYNLKSYFLIK
jgi:hypothetical protein